MELNQSVECLINEEPKPWSKKYTNLEKCLVIALCFAGCVILACLINVTVRRSDLRNCSTRDCIKISAEVVKHIDKNIDPCKNFYQFVCGKLVNVTHEKHTPTTILRNQIRKQFDILMEPLDDGDHVFTTWGKKLYNACLNDSENDSSLQTLKIIFKELNGWPVLEGDDWNENKFNLEDMMGRFRRNGLYFSSLLELYLTNDHLEPNKAILRASFPYWTRLQKNEEHVNKLMTDVAVLFGANETLASYEILKVVEFGVKLRGLRDAFLNMNHTDDHTISYEQLKDFQKFGSTDWLKLINNILDPITKFRPNDIVEIPYSVFLIDLEKLFNNTSKRVIANYMFWCAIDEVLPFLLHNYKDTFKGYHCILGYTRNNIHDICSRAIGKSIGILPVYLSYAQKHLTRSTKRKATEIYNKIKKEFNNLLYNVNIDIENKKIIKESFDTMKEIIGLEEENIHDIFFKDITEEVEEKDFMKMFLYYKWKLENVWLNYLHLNISIHTHLEYFTIPIIRTRYIDDINTFILPVGMLHNMFNDQNKPMYTFFANLGRRIGISFVNIINRVETPTEKINDFWSKAVNATCINAKYEHVFSEEEFEEYYKKYRIDELIAEQIGLHVSYNAYQKWVAENEKELSVIGLNYTPNQLFWIYTVADTCFEEDMDILKLHQNNAVVYENTNFINDFQCNTKINIANKCNVF
ncbi:hypothetical protein FQA39_LY09381 [Lamprigera yunnana]|nr:hypothetical protein FQA39_LY09381 [Lamprigera yunnana]